MIKGGGEMIEKKRLQDLEPGDIARLEAKVDGLKRDMDEVKTLFRRLAMKTRLSGVAQR